MLDAVAGTTEGVKRATSNNSVRAAEKGRKAQEALNGERKRSFWENGEKG